MNMKISVFDFCVEAIINLSLYNLHGCSFKHVFLFCVIEKQPHERVLLKSYFNFFFQNSVEKSCDKISFLMKMYMYYLQHY